MHSTVELLLLLLAVASSTHVSAFPLSADNVVTEDDTADIDTAVSFQETAEDDPMLSQDGEVAFAGNETIAEVENNGTIIANDSDSTNRPFDDIIKSVRDHNKERRLQVIRDTILNSTGRIEHQPGGVMNTPSPKMMDFFSRAMLPLSDYTEKRQSFYPVCLPMKQPTAAPSISETGQTISGTAGIPTGDVQTTISNNQPLQHVITKADDRDSSNLFLYFNLSYPTPLVGSVLNVVSAHLKLYKYSELKIDEVEWVSRVQDDQSNANTVAPCVSRRLVETAAALEAAAMAGAAEVDGNSPLTPLPMSAPAGPTEPYVDDDRRIRVSVYLNIRKKNRLRRKLLDTKMIPVSGNEWVDLNVRAAARTWRNTAKNLGLVVEVEDEEGKQMVASRFFSDMNCSKEASTSRPIPSFLFDAFREFNGYENTSYQYNTNLFPVIDLCTKPEKKATAASPDHTSDINFALDHHNKHTYGFEGEEPTFFMLIPHNKISEFQAALQHPHHQQQHNQHNQHQKEKFPQLYPMPMDEDEETLEVSKNNSESHRIPTQPHHGTVNPDPQVQILADDPSLLDSVESQYEQPLRRRHRHDRNQHPVDSDEELSFVSKSSYPERQRHHEDMSEESSKEQETHTAARRPSHHGHDPSHRQHHATSLHHRCHHRGHQFHTDSGIETTAEDHWNDESSRRVIIVPASDLLVIADTLEREKQNKQHPQRHDDFER